MKVIIDISEEVYEECRGDIYFPDTGGELFDAVKNGTPLDDVRAEIKIFTITEKSEYDTGFNDAVLKCFNVLDNIGKAESEGKE